MSKEINTSSLYIGFEANHFLLGSNRHLECLYEFDKRRFVVTG